MAAVQDTAPASHIGRTIAKRPTDPADLFCHSSVNAAGRGPASD